MFHYFICYNIERTGFYFFQGQKIKLILFEFNDMYVCQLSQIWRLFQKENGEVPLQSF